MRSQQSKTEQKNLILYFQVHQPKRLQSLRFFDIGSKRGYFDDALNRDIIQRVARNCYLPANALLLSCIEENPQIKVAFSISGIAMEQLEDYAPEVLDSFKRLAETGSVEFLAETYYHSLACMMPGNEFELQVAKHQNKIRQYFGVQSAVFRNTELIYSDDIGRRVSDLGFKGVLIDGVDRMLAGESCRHVFQHACVENIKLLLRDYRLSDDISFRYSQFADAAYASRYVNWLQAIPSDDEVITLGMDYETFGEHQKSDTGIFQFLEEVIGRLSADDGFKFLLPSEAVDVIPARKPLVVPQYISWADEARDVSAWLGNDMQRDAFDSLAKLEKDVKNLHDKAMLEQWRTLQTSDHFYYMATKKGNDGEVHAYFSPYPSPYEAFINFMNVLTDFSLRLKMARTSTDVGQVVADREVPAALEVAL